MKLFLLILPLFTISCESVEVVHRGTDDARPIVVDMYYTQTESGMPVQVFDFSLDLRPEDPDLELDVSLDLDPESLGD
jgi:hypothetical protein